MKYINERELYNKSDIEKAMGRSIKSGDIKMNISFDEFVNKSLNLQQPPIGSFEGMVQNGFISMGSERQMEDFLNRFKQLDIDTSKLETLFPAYKEYLKYPMDQPSDGDYSIYGYDQRKWTREEDPTGEGWWREDSEARLEYEKDLEEWEIKTDEHEVIILR
jgi:hypothetical protein